MEQRSTFNALLALTVATYLGLSESDRARTWDSWNDWMPSLNQGHVGCRQLWYGFHFDQTLAAGFPLYYHGTTLENALKILAKGYLYGIPKTAGGRQDSECPTDHEVAYASPLPKVAVHYAPPQLVPGQGTGRQCAAVIIIIQPCPQDEEFPTAEKQY